MPETARAWALMDRIDEGVAERVDPTVHGEAIVSTRLNHVYDQNFLRVRQADGADARDLAEEAEAAQGRYPQIRHRRVNVRGADTAERLEPGFAELGWKPERFVLMVRRRDADRDGDATVREVEADAMRGPWTAAGRSFGGSEELVRQMVEHHRAIGTALPTRYFAVEVDGRIAAYCELYSSAGAAQVENVVTLPEFRGRGFARALVLHAADEARAGHDLTFLVADADDWPWTFYEKLGFDVEDRYARFLKAP
jgi:ribosomal protein S18 acetylase RimI-like enzyme